MHKNGSRTSTDADTVLETGGGFLMGRKGWGEPVLYMTQLLGETEASPLT